MIAPWLTGHIVDVGADPASGFRQGFLFAGALVCLGGLLAMILIDPVSDLARFRVSDAADRNRFPEYPVAPNESATSS